MAPQLRNDYRSSGIHYHPCTGCLVSILPLESIQSQPSLYTPYKITFPNFLRRLTRVALCQCPTFRNRTVYTALVAITRRRVVVGCHAMLFLAARRRALFEPNTVLWVFHTMQPSSITLPIESTRRFIPSASSGLSTSESQLCHHACLTVFVCRFATLTFVTHSLLA